MAPIQLLWALICRWRLCYLAGAHRDIVCSEKPLGSGQAACSSKAFGNKLNEKNNVPEDRQGTVKEHRSPFTRLGTLLLCATRPSSAFLSLGSFHKMQNQEPGLVKTITVYICNPSTLGEWGVGGVAVAVTE